MRIFRVTVDGTPYTVEVEELADQASAAAPPSAAQASKPASPSASSPPPQGTGQSAGPAQVAPGEVVSALAGVVNKIEVSVGQAVKQGDTLLVLEAMKMNAPVIAPSDGSVTDISVSVGASVQEGQVLMTLGE